MEEMNEQMFESKSPADLVLMDTAGGPVFNRTICDRSRLIQIGKQLKGDLLAYRILMLDMGKHYGNDRVPEPMCAEGYCFLTHFLVVPTSQRKTGYKTYNSLTKLFDRILTPPDLSGC